MKFLATVVEVEVVEVVEVEVVAFVAAPCVAAVDDSLVVEASAVLLSAEAHPWSSR